MDEKTKEVMGVQSESNEGWQKRAAILCNPAHWTVAIFPGQELQEGLTDEEASRLVAKVKLVENAVKYMLAGMVKGTIKYPTDNYDPKRWLSHLVAEGADQMNYTILTAAAILDALSGDDKVNK